MKHRRRNQSDSEESSSTSSSSSESGSSSSGSSDRGIMKYLKEKARAEKNLKRLKKMKVKWKKKKRVNEKDEHDDDEGGSSNKEKKNRRRSRRSKSRERRTHKQHIKKKGGQESYPLAEEINEQGKKVDISDSNPKKTERGSSNHPAHTAKNFEGEEVVEEETVTNQEETETETLNTHPKLKDKASTEERISAKETEETKESKTPPPRLIKQELGEPTEREVKTNTQDRGEGGKTESEAKDEEDRNYMNPNEKRNTMSGNRKPPLQLTEDKSSGETAVKENMQERDEGGGKESKAEEEEGRNVMNSNEREDIKRGSKMTPPQPTKKELGKETEEENPEKGEEDKKTEFVAKGKEGRLDKNSKEASSKNKMESTSKEKSRHRREGDKHTMVSTSREKRRHEGDEGEKPPKVRKGSEPLEYDTFACYATEDDRKFIENRSSYRTEDPSELLQEQVPTVELAGRDIYKDMARIESCMKQSYFSLERVAKSTATGLRMCPFYNLKACSFAQATHINGTREVAHFCISCYTSANVLLGHPVQECPNLNVRIRR